MPPRFYCDRPITCPAVTLEGMEHHHLAHVMRLSVGDSVSLFDDSGFEFTATIRTIGRRATELVVTEKQDVNRELPFDITLAVALPKGDRQQWLIEKVVELGVRRFIPLVTERAVAQPRAKALQRLEKWVIAASKQCGRTRLMKIETPQVATAFFESHEAIVPHPDPVAMTLVAFLGQPQSRRDELFVAIGPEGGFTDRELTSAKSAGCSIVNLGARILRVETAAFAVVAALIYGRCGRAAAPTLQEK